MPMACVVPVVSAVNPKGFDWSRVGRSAQRRGLSAVQQESTATGPDSGGLMRTSRDGDLRGWTRADVLPADGMQEVRGSNPRSSTGQKRNSNCSYGEYSSKVQQRGPHDLLPGQPGSALLPRLGCWHSRLKPEPGTDFGAVTRKNASFAPPWTPAPALAHGARFRVTLAACARGQASRSAGEHAINGLSWWVSCAGLRQAPGRFHGASATHRGKIRHSLGRAAAAPGAGQAFGGALPRPRQARRASGMPGGRPRVDHAGLRKGGFVR